MLAYVSFPFSCYCSPALTLRIQKLIISYFTRSYLLNTVYLFVQVSVLHYWYCLANWLYFVFNWTERENRLRFPFSQHSIQVTPLV